jgi:hypothetical protein
LPRHKTLLCLQGAYFFFLATFFGAAFFAAFFFAAMSLPPWKGLVEKNLAIGRPVPVSRSGSPLPFYTRLQFQSFLFLSTTVYFK